MTTKCHSRERTKVEALQKDGEGEESGGGGGVVGGRLVGEY